MLSRDRRTRLLASAGCVLLVLSGCSSTPDAAGGLPTVRMQALSGGSSPIILKVIEEQGLDAANGFHGEMQYVDADSSVQNFLQGHSDVNLDSDILTAAIAREKGHKISVVGPGLTANQSIIVREDSPYRTPKDLVGKKVGHFGTDSATTISMRALLKQQYGVDLTTDYELVKAGPAALVQLLKQKRVDAIFNFEPNTSRAELEVPARTIFTAKDAWPDESKVGLWLSNLVVHDEWAKANPELARAVKRAYDQAYQYLRENNYEPLKEDAYRELLKIEDDEVLNTYIEHANALPLYVNQWTESNRRAANETLDAFAELGVGIKNNPPGTITTLDKLVGASSGAKSTAPTG